MTILRFLFFLIASQSILGCGGESSNQPKKITGLQLEVSARTFPEGQFFDITAYTVLEDGSIQSNTRISDWVSSSPNIASITELTNNSVRIYTSGVGDVSITASYQQLNASLSFAITPPEIVDVEIELELRLLDSIAKGAYFRLYAIGELTNQGKTDITDQVQWSTSHPEILQIIEKNDVLNLKGENFGSAAITARLGGFDYEKEFTVLDIQALDTNVANFLFFDSDFGADDLQYSAYSVSNFPLENKLKLNIYNESLELINESTITENLGELGIRFIKVAANSDSNSATQAVTAYTTLNELFVTTFINNNWTAPIPIDSGESEGTGFTEAVDIKMDESGNALLVWSRFDQGFYSIYTSATESWSTATAIPEFEFLRAFPRFTFVMDKTGQSIILWQSWDSTTRWHLYSTTIDISDPTQASWSSPLLIHSDRAAIPHDLTSNENGQILVTYGSEDDFVRVIDYDGDNGWSSPIIVSNGGNQDGENPKIVVNKNGYAAVFWHHDYDKNLWVSRFQPDKGWLAPEQINHATASGPANPNWLAFRITEENKIIAQFFFAAGNLIETTHTEDEPWQILVLEDIAWTYGKGTITYNAETELNSDGKGMMIWEEIYSTFFEDGSNGSASDLYIAPYRLD